MKLLAYIKFAACLALLSTRICHGSFGVSSRSKVDQSLLTAATISSISTSTLDPRTLCEGVGVRGWSRRQCGRSVGVARVLVEAARAGVTQCQALLRHQRWNCSLGRTRRMIMRKVFPETAFLQAVSAASVCYVVSRACARGRLTHCPCGTSHQNEVETLRAWSYGGCSDNVSYGQRFTEKVFFGSRRRKLRPRSVPGDERPQNSTPINYLLLTRDFKSQIDSHNARVGIMTVARSAQQMCKCHGASGSCSMKTCWIQLPPFVEAARELKRLYDIAVLATTNNQVQIPNRPGKIKLRLPRAAVNTSATYHNFDSSPQDYKPLVTKTYNQAVSMESKDVQLDKLAHSSHSRQQLARDSNTISRQSSRGHRRTGQSSLRRPSLGTPLGDPTKLVYLDRSPDFCRKNKYGPGTRGRSCDKRRNCDVLCCGRGYDTAMALLKESCRCQVVWCCKVNCHSCFRAAEVLTCK